MSGLLSLSGWLCSQTDISCAAKELHQLQHPSLSALSSDRKHSRISLPPTACSFHPQLLIGPWCLFLSQSLWPDEELSYWLLRLDWERVSLPREAGYLRRRVRMLICTRDRCPWQTMSFFTTWHIVVISTCYFQDLHPQSTQCELFSWKPSKTS